MSGGRVKFLLPVLALAAGLGIGVSLRGSRAEGDAAVRSGDGKSGSTGRVVEGAGDGQRRAGKTNVESVCDLAAVKRMLIPQEKLPPAERAALQRLSTGDLRELIQRAGSKEPKYDRSAAEAWGLAVVAEAAEELCRRDLPGTLEWALGIYQKTMEGKRYLAVQKEIQWLGPLMRVAGRVDFLGVCAWLDKGPKERRGLSVFFERRVATDSGYPESDVTLEQARQEEDWGVVLEEGLPPGFDLSRVVRETKSDATRWNMIRYWAALDREAAYTAVQGRLEQAPALWTSLCAGMAQTAGEATTASWIVSKLEGVPTDQRGAALNSISEEASTERVEAMMGRLSTDADRLSFAKSVLGNPITISSAPNEPAERALRLLGSEDQQVESLLYAMDGSLSLRMDLLRVVSKLNLSPEAKKRISEASR